MRELTRVRQYVNKIKSAAPAVQPIVLDKAAANRFIKAALAGNDQYDTERAEREARERAGAEAKLAALGPREEEVIVVRKPEVEEEEEEEEEEKEKELEIIDEEGGKRKRKGGGERKRPKRSVEEKEKRRAERKGLFPLPMVAGDADIWGFAETRKDVRKKNKAAVA